MVECLGVCFVYHVCVECIALHWVLILCWVCVYSEGTHVFGEVCLRIYFPYIHVYRVWECMLMLVLCVCVFRCVVGCRTYIGRVCVGGC